ncbi:hypothetical protein XA68_14364 [Ophiocordyceps unilateralis]|uniref:Uncharacterized protein n=1 Tax=Ophiocordyceps unilateralis TaxID=268505 RepID=A0A2A9P944_OPHUN|nr:hypothetical protein XA68_14364 [Ophiocordyceps unilateralis]
MPWLRPIPPALPFRPWRFGRLMSACSCTTWPERCQMKLIAYPTLPFQRGGLCVCTARGLLHLISPHSPLSFPFHVRQQAGTGDGDARRDTHVHVATRRLPLSLSAIGQL